MMAHLFGCAAPTLAHGSVAPEVAEWLGKIGVDLYGKLVNIGLVEERESGTKKSHTQLKAFLDVYIESRSDAKQSTRTFYGLTRRCLLAFFGAKKRLSAITLLMLKGSADG